MSRAVNSSGHIAPHAYVRDDYPRDLGGRPADPLRQLDAPPQVFIPFPPSAIAHLGRPLRGLLTVPVIDHGAELASRSLGVLEMITSRRKSREVRSSSDKRGKPIYSDEHRPVPRLELRPYIERAETGGTPSGLSEEGPNWRRHAYVSVAR